MMAHVQVMPRQKHTALAHCRWCHTAHLVIWSPMMSALRMARCLRAKIACFKMVNCRQ